MREQPAVGGGIHRRGLGHLPTECGDRRRGHECFGRGGALAVCLPSALRSSKEALGVSQALVARTECRKLPELSKLRPN